MASIVWPPELLKGLENAPEAVRSESSVFCFGQCFFSGFDAKKSCQTCKKYFSTRNTVYRSTPITDDELVKIRIEDTPSLATPVPLYVNPVVTFDWLDGSNLT